MGGEWLLAFLVSWRSPGSGTEGKEALGGVKRPGIASDHNVQRRWVGAIVGRISWDAEADKKTGESA